MAVGLITCLAIGVFLFGGRAIHLARRLLRTTGQTVGPVPTLDLPAPPAALYVAPRLVHALVNADPGLADRGPRPEPADLRFYAYGSTSLIHLRGALATDWQLANPDQASVSGYGGSISVAPGDPLELHLAGHDPSARLDVFRVGAHDAMHLLTVPGIGVSPQPQALPRPNDGLVEERWPVSYRLVVPGDWQSGVYLAKLTGSSGGDSYVLFVVRVTTAPPLLVVVPKSRPQK